MEKERIFGSLEINNNQEVTNYKEFKFPKLQKEKNLSC